ncbi:MAG: ASCH domain-containing protein [SAR202 cluster bacterium]|nr:ASCH domain-containing protein [Chloroflexota bacterium]MDP6421857.1 ASCH domain-containing protein [SAR202 cluster bacterium]HAL49614.1 ASCH domain-containing protein [Dehalococcoidia bacterium]MDP6662520.1 ASCH domain-containing protein [SAR202 cluster bacterium]MDP6799712.1 ASCH domain-containing protein [SAR202 cluster bacterium]
MTASDIPSVVQPFWDSFVAAADLHTSPVFSEAFFFGDNERDANALAELVLSGTKRATTSLFWAYGADNDPIPKPGDFSVVTSWDGQPLCVIETAQVDICPYGDVTEAYAAVEGEGDGSLRHWREVHWDAFSRECSRIGRTPAPRMPVVCERFKVVYQPDT